jgi:F-type H+-transporting ATPase subunit gamma
MSKLTELRERIRTVENIQRVTRTLATVAAARLSRARRRAAGMREYAGRFREVLLRQQRHLARAGLEITRYSDLLRPREPVRTVALLVVTADRGMCGGYNLEACRLATEQWETHRAAGRSVRFLVIGRKGARFLRKRGADIVHQENWRREGVSTAGVERLLELLLQLYRSGEVDAVDAAYTQFHTAIRREPRVRKLLPVQLESSVAPDVADAPFERWHYEPAFQDVIDEFVTVYLRVQLGGLLMESHASEQGARMITMEEATERADKTLQGYRVQHNRLRREVITTDLLGALFASRAIEASPPGAPGPG